MANNTSRMAYLLGELRREMNGAVVGSMRYYGAEYGLNYGVSIPTIRSLARTQEGCDHTFAKYLYLQEVRELRLLALWFADPKIMESEIDFWAKGIINSEVAEEASFIVLKDVPSVVNWLYSDSELLQYTALMSMAGELTSPTDAAIARTLELIAQNPALLPKGVVITLEKWLHKGYRSEVERVIQQLPDNGAGRYITEEMEWRL